MKHAAIAALASKWGILMITAIVSIPIIVIRMLFYLELINNFW